MSKVKKSEYRTMGYALKQHPEFKANVDKCKNITSLDVYQASALCLGFNPKLVNKESVDGYPDWLDDYTFDDDKCFLEVFTKTADFIAQHFDNSYYLSMTAFGNFANKHKTKKYFDNKFLNQLILAVDEVETEGREKKRMLYVIAGLMVQLQGRDGFSKNYKAKQLADKERTAHKIMQRVECDMSDAGITINYDTAKKYIVEARRIYNKE